MVESFSGFRILASRRRKEKTLTYKIQVPFSGLGQTEHSIVMGSPSVSVSVSVSEYKTENMERICKKKKKRKSRPKGESSSSYSLILVPRWSDGC